jgi:hypothetical protein
LLVAVAPGAPDAVTVCVTVVGGAVTVTVAPGAPGAVTVTMLRVGVGIY